MVNLEDLPELINNQEISLTDKILHCSPDYGIPYLIYPEGYRKKRPYGKGIILISEGNEPRKLMAAIIEKYNLPNDLMHDKLMLELATIRIERHRMFLRGELAEDIYFN